MRSTSQSVWCLGLSAIVASGCVIDLKPDGGGFDLDGSVVPPGSGGDGGSTDGGGGDGGAGNSDGGLDGGDGGQTGDLTIRGSWVARYTWDTGEVTKPLDLTNFGILARVEDAGVFVDYPAVADSDGGFTIANVPPGLFYLKLGQYYAYGSERNLTIVNVRRGRPDVVNPSLFGPDLTLSVSNLAPWQPTDTLQIVSSNSGSGASRLESYGDTPPDAGETNLAMTLDYAKLRTPLIEGSKGDQTWLVQVGTIESDGGVTTRAVSRTLTSSSFTQASGQPGTLAGTFTPVPTTTTWALSLNRAAFEALGNQVAGPLGFRYHFATLYAHMGDASQVLYAAGATIAEAAGYAGPSTVDVSIVHGDPFPGPWSRVIQYGMTFSRSLAAGTAQPSPALAYVQTWIPGTSNPVGTLSPLLGPVQAVQIAGKDAFAPQSIFATPALSWSAPALGSPNRYTVEVVRVYASGGVTTGSSAGTFVTQQTHLTVPPGVLSSGQSYFFRIIAIQAPGIDFAKQPFAAFPLQTSRADAVTELMTVQ